MLIIKFNGWNAVFFLNFSLIATIPPSSCHLRLVLKMTTLVIPLLTLSQLTSLLPNMNKSPSTMLLSINNTFQPINDKIYSTYYQNTKNYLMAPLESILITKFTLTSNWEPSQCITMLTSSLMYTNNPSKKNSTTRLILVSLNHVGPLNGHP